jgi:hypothetical protein
VGPRWRTLVEAPWTLEPGVERYVCALATVGEDLLVRRFSAVAPRGTHHALVTLAEPGGADGVFGCSAETLSDTMVLASGIGSSDLELPPGVAMRIPATKQVLLNLHILNPGVGPLAATSGVRVQLANPEEVVSEAEMVFVGTSDIAVPAGEEATRSGRCTFTQDATVIVVWPHMHRFGVHLSVAHHGGDGMTTLHDEPFDFNEQRHYPVAPTLVRAGEQLEVTCTWHNPTSAPLTFGESTRDEMCFAGIVRYPASGTSLFCGD